MEDGKNKGITPYRMNQIMKTASKITELLVVGRYLCSPTYHECEIVIELVAEALKKGEKEYRMNTGGSDDVSK